MAEKRRTYSITFNKGIDKASLPFEANPARALDAINYVYRDGKVQKRYGINQLLNYEPIMFHPLNHAANLVLNKTRINGIWRFQAEDGNYHTVIHIGYLLYELTENAQGTWSLDLFSQGNETIDGINYPKAYRFISYPSTAVIGNKSLYFFSGVGLFRVRFRTGQAKSCVEVYNDQDTYIPTTTISVTYENAKASGRQSLDQVNLLSDWRKNKLLSGVGRNDDAGALYTKDSFGYVYHLDSPIYDNKGNFYNEDFSDVRVTITRRKR